MSYIVSILFLYTNGFGIELPIKVDMLLNKGINFLPPSLPPYLSLYIYIYVYILLNKSWRQHPTRHQLYSHLPPITKIIQVRRTRHAGHCWRSRDELISDVLLWTSTYGRAKAGRPAQHTFSSYVRIRYVALKTCQRRWTIGRSGERGSGISVLAAWHDDDDDILLLLLAIIVEGDQKAPFSIATTPRCRGALLQSLDCSTLTFDKYLIFLSAK